MDNDLTLKSAILRVFELRATVDAFVGIFNKLLIFLCGMCDLLLIVLRDNWNVKTMWRITTKKRGGCVSVMSLWWRDWLFCIS